MTYKFSLSIDKPCSENFNSFYSTRSGGFCNSCQKEVIDFTKLSDVEITNYFKKYKEKTCGRFSKSQLKRYSYSTIEPNRTNFKWIGVSIIGLSLLASNSDLNAQKKDPEPKIQVEDVDAKKVNNSKDNEDVGFSVTGLVTSVDDGLPLPGVNVVIKGTTMGTITNIDGRYTLNDLKENDILVFSFIGLMTEEVNIRRQDIDNGNMQIQLTEMSMEEVFLGEVSVDQVYTSKKSIWLKIKELF